MSDVSAVPAESDKDVIVSDDVVPVIATPSYHNDGTVTHPENAIVVHDVPFVPGNVVQPTDPAAPNADPADVANPDVIVAPEAPVAEATAVESPAVVSDVPATEVNASPLAGTETRA